VQLASPAGVNRIDVVSAEQMHAAALNAAVHSDIFIGCAAVADYRAATIAPGKIKKGSADELQLTLVKNPDIIAAVASLTERRPFTVGFAAETADVLRYARQKLISKKLDMICANDVSLPDAGFNSEQNAITAIWHSGEQVLELQNKAALAASLISLISEHFSQQSSQLFSQPQTTSETKK
jgi:phosphopantothenoylcysteine decarboxylase/phosphopantothenate--cysteine ligase